MDSTPNLPASSVPGVEDRSLKSASPWTCLARRHHFRLKSVQGLSMTSIYSPVSSTSRFSEVRPNLPCGELFAARLLQVWLEGVVVVVSRMELEAANQRLKESVGLI